MLSGYRCDGAEGTGRDGGVASGGWHEVKKDNLCRLSFFGMFVLYVNHCMFLVQFECDRDRESNSHGFVPLHSRFPFRHGFYHSDSFL